MRLLLSLLLALVVTPAFAAEKKEFDAKDLQALKVDNSSGKIDIIAGNGPKATVDIDKVNFNDSCKLEVARKEATLIVDVRQPSSFFSRKSCDVNLKITVPKNVTVDISNGSGNLSLKGIEGKTVFKLGSGDVNIDAPLKDFSGKTGSGDVALKNLSGGGDIASGSGNVEARYAKIPQGELTVRTGSGDVQVMLPKGSKVKTSYFSGAGDLTNEVGDTPGAPFIVNVKSGSGDLKIKKL